MLVMGFYRAITAKIICQGVIEVSLDITNYWFFRIMVALGKNFSCQFAYLSILIELWVFRNLGGDILMKLPVIKYLKGLYHVYAYSVLCAFYKPNEDKHMSGNGGDHAHNNQFGGGGRGPSGGVNTGSGSSNRNAGDRGYGYWKLEPSIPSPKKNDPAGEVRIEITGGMKWVSDNSIQWSDGKGGSGNDNVRTNVTAKVDHGYRAAVDGYIYTVTVNGNNAITGVYLYSRPTTPSRHSWAQTETARMTQARALVQAQLDTKKAADAAAAKKAAETAAAAAAAAEAKRKAEEEAKRQQAAWDAAHPVEAAQRHVAAATVRFMWQMQQSGVLRRNP